MAPLETAPATPTPETELLERLPQQEEARKIIAEVQQELLEQGIVEWDQIRLEAIARAPSAEVATEIKEMVEQLRESIREETMALLVPPDDEKDHVLSPSPALAA